MPIFVTLALTPAAHLLDSRAPGYHQLSMLLPAPPITLSPLDPGPLRDGDLTLHLVAFAPHPIHRVPTYHFRMASEGHPRAAAWSAAGRAREAGRINLRLGWDANLVLHAGHIGYGVHEPCRGRRFAARSVLLLRELARRHGFPELWITCDPDNLASSRSCELAGGVYVETVDLPPDSVFYARGLRRKRRYRLPLA